MNDLVKRKKRKVGSSYITMRKIRGKRRKVRVTKLSREKEKIRMVGKKRRGRKRR